jgi:hypothetical protein
MTKAQIDAWYAAEDARLGAPGFKNCMREIDAAARNKQWAGPPTMADCEKFAHDLRQKGIDMLDEAIKGAPKDDDNERGYRYALH